MNLIFDVLSNAKNLLVNPANWTQKARARDAGGLPVSDSDPTAICFCASSALWKASDVSTPEGAMVAMKARKALQKAMRDDIFDFNDENDHADILKAFDRAMAKIGRY